MNIVRSRASGRGKSNSKQIKQYYGFHSHLIVGLSKKSTRKNFYTSLPKRTLNLRLNRTTKTGSLDGTSRDPIFRAAESSASRENMSGGNTRADRRKFCYRCKTRRPRC